MLPAERQSRKQLSHIVGTGMLPPATVIDYAHEGLTPPKKKGRERRNALYQFLDGKREPYNSRVPHTYLKYNRQNGHSLYIPSGDNQIYVEVQNQAHNAEIRRLMKKAPKSNNRGEFGTKHRGKRVSTRLFKIQRAPVQITLDAMHKGKPVKIKVKTRSFKKIQHLRGDRV